LKTSNATQRRKQTELATPRRNQIVGVDVSDKTSHYCVLGDEGEIFAEGTLRTTPAGFTAQFQSANRCRVVLEVGTHSPWISRLLCGLGHEVIVANAGRVRMIYDNDNKNDRVDARTLALGADGYWIAASDTPSQRYEGVRENSVAVGSSAGIAHRPTTAGSPNDNLATAHVVELDIPGGTVVCGSSLCKTARR
jgi:hypothetical protein